MRALHFDGTRAAVRDLPPPEPNAETAVVRVQLAGVCNTDLELVKGYMGFRGVLGHEFVGTVADGPADVARPSAWSARSTSPAGAVRSCRAGPRAPLPDAAT